jgi:cellulose synthase/poly-beta-1,6-N-acetylglucosamine synthase-like glycosyltransferase
MSSLFQILAITGVFYISATVLYLLVFSIAGRFYTSKRSSDAHAGGRIAVLVPAYHEDAVITSSAKSLLDQDYPSELFDVVVIADGLLTDTLNDLYALPVRVIEVAFEQSTKAKALQQALRALPPGYYDFAIVMDADNTVDRNFVSQMSRALQSGAQVVQAHRTAKNTNTRLALLDGLSEEINNHIFRKGHRVLGLSAGLIGSGMGFHYGLFSDLMSRCEAVGGFDKELELELTAEGCTVDYLDHVLVKDEKVDRADRFVGQRRRWLAAQGHYALRGIRHLIRLSPREWRIDHIDKVIQMFLPPRVMLILLLPILTALMFFWQPVLALVLLVLACLLCCTMLLSLPDTLKMRQFGHALWGLPGVGLLMLQAMLGVYGANRQFIHTRHDAPQSVNKPGSQ